HACKWIDWISSRDIHYSKKGVLKACFFFRLLHNPLIINGDFSQTGVRLPSPPLNH
ncbi:MAG: hypothetical protein ACI9NC_000959, partial [Verrucomicrobiales bacterium]